MAPATSPPLSSTPVPWHHQPSPSPSHAAELGGPPPERPWVVLKFGGTSVSRRVTWEAIAARAQEIFEKEQCDVWITVSAVSQVTNKLIACLTEEASNAEDANIALEWILKRHDELRQDLELTDEEFEPVKKLLEELQRMLRGVALTGEVTYKLRAKVLATGELCSSNAGRAFLTRYFERLPHVNVAWADARKLIVSTERVNEYEETRYGEADVLPRVAVEEVEAHLASQPYYDGSKQRRLVITQGFIGSTKAGHTCVLGRGGSDTSGALFAALLRAKRCEIWTDVYGCFTCDPRLVKGARLIRKMSYREAQELAAMGAKVLHPRCLGPAQWAGIPVEVRNTMDPQGSDRGNMTIVCVNPDEDSSSLVMKPPRVVAVTKRTDQTLLTVQNFDMWGATGFLSRVFAPFGSMGIPVDHIATSEYSVSMTLDNIPGGPRGSLFARLVTELRAIVPKGSVTVEEQCAVVSIVGRRLRHALPSLSEALRCMEGVDVRMVTQSAEDLSLSFVVGGVKEAKAGYIDALVAKLHAALFEGKETAYVDEIVPEDDTLGASWEELATGKKAAAAAEQVLNGANAPRTPTLAPSSAAVNSALKGLANRRALTRSSPGSILSLKDPKNNLQRLAQDFQAFSALDEHFEGVYVFCDPAAVEARVAEATARDGERLVAHVSDVPIEALASLMRAKVALFCETLGEVEKCSRAATEAGVDKDVLARAVHFAPLAGAPVEDFKAARFLGDCRRFVIVDDADFAPDLAAVFLSVDPKDDSVILITSDNGHAVADYKAATQKTRLVPLNVGSSYCLAARVTRVSGATVTARRLPFEDAAAARDFIVVNADRPEAGSKTVAKIGALSDETKVNDVLVFFPAKTHEGATLAHDWWRNAFMR